MHFSNIALASFVGLIAASTVQAQQIGTYTGTTADGAAVSITVAQDPNNSNLEVKVLSFDIDMPCEKSGETLSHIGIGLGDGYDITNHAFNYSTSDFYGIDLIADMTFKGNTSVKGTVAGELAAFNPAYGHTTFISNVQRCDDPKQKFSAAWGPGGRMKTLTPDVTIRGKDGTTITIGYQPRSVK